ncbi:MAG TPA: alpha-amylase family glycosyl hydrolase [Pseudonocardiaceae bacterium]|nr:alpha-amylase family glycosyl hydrolase [Pseudonocardiaceae bacterium]
MRRSTYRLFGNYASAWSDMNLGQYLLNTVVQAGGAWVLQIVLCTARIDSAALLVKNSHLPDMVLGGRPGAGDAYADHDGVHDIYRAWRRVAEEYPDRALIGEIWLPDTERFARYLRGDELHVAFNFDFLCCPWDAERLRARVDATLAAHQPVGAPATWVLSNHDVVRHVTRYGRADTSFDMGDRRIGEPTDLALGERRARAAALLTLRLPGGAYSYQGEELGLAEVEDLPDAARQDPIWQRSGHTDFGRDGCRVPLPWSGGHQPFGFSPDGATGEPWLPQPASWADRTVQAEAARRDSMLALYREALHIRRGRRELGDGPMTWLPSAPGVLAFSRGEGFACVVNLGRGPADLPSHKEVLVVSHQLVEGKLPAGHGGVAGDG